MKFNGSIELALRTWSLTLLCLLLSSWAPHRLLSTPALHLQLLGSPVFHHRSLPLVGGLVMSGSCLLGSQGRAKQPPSGYCGMTAPQHCILTGVPVGDPILFLTEEPNVSWCEDEILCDCPSLVPWSTGVWKINGLPWYFLFLWVLQIM